MALMHILEGKNMSVHIYYQSISDIKIDDQLLSMLQPQRKKQLASLRFEEDKKRCAAAGLLLWKHLYHEHPENYSVSYNACGKPSVLNAPFFNLSHSNELVMLAICDLPVGCDLEHVRKAVLSHHVFHPEELSFLSSITPGNKRDFEFLRLWTAKEAFLKAIGTGISAKASSFDLSKGDTISLSDGTSWKLTHYAIPNFPNYLSCTCHQLF